MMNIAYNRYVLYARTPYSVTALHNDYCITAAARRPRETSPPPQFTTLFGVDARVACGLAALLLRSWPVRRWRQAAGAGFHPQLKLHATPTLAPTCRFKREATFSTRFVRCAQHVTGGHVARLLPAP